MSDNGPILLFDGVCSLCDHSVQFILDHEAAGTFRFASLQSAAGKQLLDQCGLRDEPVDSVVLVEDGTCYVQSEAVWRVAARLDAPWRWVALGRWIPRAGRDWAYSIVARHRYQWFGTRDQCRLPQPGVRNRFLDAAELMSQPPTAQSL